jgi:hypothetical protein
MVAILNSGQGTPFHESLENRFASDQWKPAQVMAVQIEQIEYVVEQLAFLAPLSVAQPFEMRPTLFIEYDYLTVENCFVI